MHTVFGWVIRSSLNPVDFWINIAEIRKMWLVNFWTGGHLEVLGLLELFDSSSLALFKRHDTR